MRLGQVLRMPYCTASSLPVPTSEQISLRRLLLSIGSLGGAFLVFRCLEYPGNGV